MAFTACRTEEAAWDCCWSRSNASCSSVRDTPETDWSSCWNCATWAEAVVCCWVAVASCAPRLTTIPLYC